MNDPTLIRNRDVEISTSKYLAIFKEFGQITFELTEDEKNDLLRAVNQFKEIKEQPPGFDQKKWIKENIVPFSTGPAFGVFSFMIVVWRRTTTFQSLPSDQDGYTDVCVINESAAQ